MYERCSKVYGKKVVTANLKGVTMKKAIYPNLFKPMKLKGLRLKNRITMAPLYLGYAGSDGTVSPLLLYHYKLMAQSGAAMIVVENACNWLCRGSPPSARDGAGKSELSTASCFNKYEAFR